MLTVCPPQPNEYYYVPQYGRYSMKNCHHFCKGFKPASRQLPPGQHPPGQHPPGQVPIWTNSWGDNCPPDKFLGGQLPPGQIPGVGTNSGVVQWTTTPRITSPRTSTMARKLSGVMLSRGILSASHFAASHIALGQPKVRHVVLLTNSYSNFEGGCFSPHPPPQNKTICTPRT